MSELLDPGDRAYADEQAYDAGSDRGEGDRPDKEPGGIVSAETDDDGNYVIGIREDPPDPGDGVMPDGSEPPGCPHPPSERRMDDGVQVCLACGMPVEEWERQAIVPKDRPGSDPTMREATAGGLKHVTVPQPGDTGRPYTPDQIERELVTIIDRIERGAGWLTTQEEKRAAAKLAYEIAYAKARFNSDGRSAEQRNDDAMLQCLDLYEEWQQLELVCRTAREGLHNLRSMQSGLQTVARSIGTALGGYR